MMRRVAIAMLLLGSLVWGQAEEGTEKKEIRSKYADKARKDLLEEIAKAEKEAAKRIEAAIKKYHSRLDKALKEYTKRGDFDRAMLVKKMRDEVKLIQTKDEDGEDKLTAKEKAQALTKSRHVEIVIWNTHNTKHKDRGAKTLVVEAFSKGKKKWKKRVAIRWSGEKNPSKSFSAASDFDELKITVEKWHKSGGGLSEVQILDSKKDNLAPKAKCTASAEYSNQFPAAAMTDGIIDAKSMNGYWLLPNDMEGWVKLTFEQDLN